MAKNARWGLTFLLLLELATLVGALFLYWCHPNTRGHNYDNFGEKSATFSSVQERFGGLRSALEKNADRGNTSSGIKLDDRMKQKYANTMHSPDEL